MIKNNFIITEEEKKHILGLTRLDNYKKPISLFEAPGDEYDLDPNVDDGGVDSGITHTKTWSKKDEDDTKKSQEQEKEKQSKKSDQNKELENLKKSGSFPYADFSNQTSVNEHSGKLISYMKDKGVRGNTIGYFLQALNIAKDLYPNNAAINTSITNIGNIITNNTKNWSDYTGDESFNFQTNPENESDYESFNPGGIFNYASLWKVKLIDPTQKIESLKIDENTCKSTLLLVQNDYQFNKLPTGQKEDLKQKLQACYHDKRNEDLKKKFFKLRYRTDGSYYDKLSRKEKEQLARINDLYKLGLTGAERYLSKEDRTISNVNNVVSPTNKKPI